MVTPATQHVVVMGVSGSGKSTVGAALAAALHWRFIEGDDYHPAENVARMSSGTPLTDADRMPWLASLAAEIARADAAGTCSVTGCSALKRPYRDMLRQAAGRVRFVHIDGTREALAARLDRPGHFFPGALLESQLAALEPLAPDEDGTVIALDLPVSRQVEAARRFLTR